MLTLREFHPQWYFRFILTALAIFISSVGKASLGSRTNTIVFKFVGYFQRLGEWTWTIGMSAFKQITIVLIRIA